MNKMKFYIIKNIFISFLLFSTYALSNDTFNKYFNISDCDIIGINVGSLCYNNCSDDTNVTLMQRIVSCPLIEIPCDTNIKSNYNIISLSKSNNNSPPRVNKCI